MKNQTEFRHADLVQRMAELAKITQDLAHVAVQQYSAEVEAILKAQNRNSNRIESCLDGMLDGNKRIAAAQFLWFLEKNGLLYRPDGSRRLADTALVAITLMMADSPPDQKALLTNMVAQLIHDEE